jgi:predicted acyltransferase
MTKPRLVSLDAFRGATIALMVLVNTPGDGRNTYAPLKHAEWHGWTITDVVFPSFVWIVGVSLTLSLAKRMASGDSRKQIYLQVLRRAAILYALGLFLYGFPAFNLSTWRVLGVLQRIAICYAAAAAIYLTCGIRAQIAWIVGLLTSYWVLMATGGDYTVEGNLAHAVDRVILGNHNYAETKTWDPEGIVSTLPAIATALFGVMAGHILRLRKEMAERTTWLFLIGNALLVAGFICDYWIPINKKLWTSSYAMVMAGLDFNLFAASLWLVDARGYQRAAKPLVILGMNAILVYMASEVLDVTLNALHWKRPIYETVFAPLASPINASLLFAVSYVLLMYLIAWAAYRKGWFLKV